MLSSRPIRHGGLGCRLLIAMAALVLAGCGGDGANDADTEEIGSTIETVFKTSDEHACVDLQTQAALEQSFFAKGADAVEVCENITEESYADSVEVSDVQVNGTSATAVAGISGSGFDGQTLEVALVDEDGTWKLDEFTGFVDFDPEAYASALATVSSGSGATPDDVLQCIADNVTAAPPDELQVAILSGEPDQMATYSEGCG